MQSIRGQKEIQGPSVLSSRLFERCKESLDFFANRIRCTDLALQSLRIDGSLSTGLFSSLPINDADLIVIVADDTPISIESGQVLAKAVDGRFERIIFPRRFGERVPLVHVSAPSIGTADLFRVWDLWMVHDPFVTMSPYWQKLFDGTEIVWQRNIREFARNHLPDEELKRLKVLQLAEARWRFSACYGLITLTRSGAGPWPEFEGLLPLDYPPPPGTEEFVKLWARRDRDDSWLDRPLSCLTYETHMAVAALDARLAEPPPPPLWTHVAEAFQIN